MSRINWKVWLPLIAAFVVGGLNQIIPVLPPTWAALAMIVIPALTAYFHVGEVQKAAGIR